jgi:ppGpp synthetase/RelA/SpoT-type nucleotidyltranferase
MSKKGGITKGKSHKEGGIPMVVESTGQQVELEGGEGVINKTNMASDTKFDFQGKQMTTCEIASAINSANGNGVQIDCDDVTGKKYAYEDGGVVFINYKKDEIMYEPIDGKYYANDMEFDSLEEAQKFLDSGGVNEDLRGAYERGLFKGGGGVGKKVKTFKQLETHPFVREIFYEYQQGVYDESDYIYVLHLVDGKKFETLDTGIITAPSKSRLVSYFNEYDVVNEENNFFKEGGSVTFNDAGTSMVMYHEKEGNFFFPQGQIYLYLYDVENSSKKLGKEFDWVFYPMTTMSMAWQKGYVPPLKRIWTKKFQKDKKGAEHLLGVIKAFLIEEEGKTELYIDMMSVNPTQKKKGIMSYMIKELRDTFNLTQDQITFSDTTAEGKKFISKKTYEGGGNVKDYNSLIGKYVNIYSMGVSTPTEHQIKDVMVSGENFRYRYITLKFDLGIAPIPLEEADALMNNEIIFVNDNKEEFGVQLIPNQFKEGGGVDSKIYSAKKEKGRNYIYKNGVKYGYLHTIYQRRGNREVPTIVLVRLSDGKYFKSLYTFQKDVYAWVNATGEMFESLHEEEMEQGGDVRDFSWYQDFKKQELKRGTAHEMEHVDSISKFKKKGVSDKDVAEAIAQDHLDENENYYIELDKMDVDAIKRKKKKYEHGGNVHDISKVMHPTDSKVKRVLKNDFDINFKPKNIFYPKQSLGLTRIEMPQIRGEFLPLLFDKLDNDRIPYEDLRVMPNTLKPSQNEINIDNANRLDMDSVYLKKAIVSNDNFIIDGHHRWYYCLINDIPIDITKIDLPIEEALNYIRQLDFVQVDTIEKGGRMLSDSQKTLFEVGGNIEASKYSKEIPLSIYKGIISDYDKDGISNADDLQPYKSSETKLEEVSIKDEITDIVNYRNLFVQVQQNVLNKIKDINTCGKIKCSIKTRIKTPYSIINKLRRRSLTDVKTLDKLDKKAKEFLKNKDLKGIDLYKGLTDILGFMVIVEDFESLTKLKNEVEHGTLGEVLEFEDFYKNDNNGYRAYHFLLSTESNGTFIPYELQIRTMRVNELALITHTIYKQGKLNGAYNDKISKQIELADKGNKTIARLVDKELVDKDLINRLTIQKFAMGDMVIGDWLYLYRYKVQNNANKQTSFITEFAENESEARKEINKKYKNITILSVSVNDKEYVAIDEFVDKQTDKNRVDIFETQEAFEYADQLKKGGVVYKDLSSIKPDIVNDGYTTEVDEVTIEKTGKTFILHDRKITGASGAYQLLKDFWNIENIDVVEEMNVIYLDSQNKPIAIYRHSKGGIDSTIADIEVISAVAVKTLAKGVIVSHNHPSGNLKASNADLEVSQRLKNALKLFNIILLDSMIVTKDGYYSMADDGVFRMGGNVMSNSNNNTIVIDEADTKNDDKIFLVKLKDVFYVIYEGDIVFQSNNLKEAKEDFELALYYDKANAKKKFAGGGGIGAGLKEDAQKYIITFFNVLKLIVPKNMISSLQEEVTLQVKQKGVISLDEIENYEPYNNLVGRFIDIPKLYFQDEKGKNAIVYLHYFSSGSDWYITELDKTTGEAFGYVILNGDTQNSEFGYIDIKDLVSNNKIEIDLYWSLQTLNEIFEKRFPELVDGVVEYYSKDSNLTRLTNFEVLIEKNAFKNQYEVNQLIELMIDEKGTDANMYTTMEQSFLQRYSGMGGLQKYGATGKGILWEYYTPKNIADIMWQLAYKHKSVESFDRVLENSVGVGVFVNSCPSAVGSMDCYDISKYAISICNILYGKDERFSFLNRSFETKFFDGNTSLKGNVTPIYDLVIGNPPYSEYSGKYAGMGEKKYTKAENYIDYFIFRSLDLLKSGGLLVYILGSVKGMGQDNWLESKDNYTKLKIKEKADLVDALRLGSGVFEFTDVDSDIIVLRKK